MGQIDRCVVDGKPLPVCHQLRRSWSIRAVLRTLSVMRSCREHQQIDTAVTLWRFRATDCAAKGYEFLTCRGEPGYDDGLASIAAPNLVGTLPFVRKHFLRGDASG